MNALLKRRRQKRLLDRPFLRRILLSHTMSYVIFARKYRPQVFDEVVGQEHITVTLKNAIALGRVAHAYLFTGPRGIGKTTTARIFAKALNCEHGPAPIPCNKCTQCIEITRGSSLDILEIDAASNRGIDEVRNLRDNVKFSPSTGRFKIYIIDEVHMLTTEAFNALLKTLEEPPPHAKFIFATTHPHKVPPTILSRCQRFDFRKIPKAQIIDSLKEISKNEQLHVSDEALELIAKHSDGSMRDAEVMLDQIASFAQGKVETDDVLSMLGVVDEDALFQVTDAIASRNSASALATIDSLIRNGKDPSQIVMNLIEHMRDMLISRVAQDSPALVDSSPDKIARLIRAGGSFSIEELLYCLYTLTGTADLMRKTSLTKIPLEMAAVKLCERSRIMSLDEILKRVKDLEGRLAVSPVRASGPAAVIPPVSAGAVSPGVAVKRPSRAVDEAPSASANQVSEEKPSPAAETAPAQPSPAPAAQGADKNIEEIANSWNIILDTIHAKKISVASFLVEGRPHALENGNTLVIAFPKECRFHKEALDENVENRTLVEEMVSAVLKANYRVRFVLIENGVNGNNNPLPQSPDEGSAATGTKPWNGSGKQVKKIDPVIEYAIDIFNGEMIAKDRILPKGKG